MGKVTFYKYLNYCSFTTFLVCTTKRRRNTLSICRNGKTDYSIQLISSAFLFTGNETILNISLIDFIELLKEHGVSSDIISQVIKQYEEWEM